MSYINKIIIEPIEVDELTPEDIKTGITSDASATFEIEGKSYYVPKCGGTINLDCPINENSRLRSKLYIYDRQPKNGAYFTVNSEPIKCYQKQTAKIKFYQMGPAICFGLINC